MSFPYELDLLFGSESRAIANNFSISYTTKPTSNNTQEDNGGNGKSTNIQPVKNLVFISNTFQGYTGVDNNDPKPIDAYLVFDLSKEEDEEKEAFCELARTLSFTIEESLNDYGEPQYYVFAEKELPKDWYFEVNASDVCLYHSVNLHRSSLHIVGKEGSTFLGSTGITFRPVLDHDDDKIIRVNLTITDN